MAKLYLYCQRPSTGALELVKALGGTRLRRFDGMDFWNKRRRFGLEQGDLVVCWGAHLPELEGIRVLNSMPDPPNKLRELVMLMEKGVPTINYYEDRPNRPDMICLGRRANHMGGSDLMSPPARPDFWVTKLNFVKEYRIHSFEGRSIRAGIKEHREGFQEVAEPLWHPNANLVHPWIRSFEGGWRINYDGFVSTAKMRKMAHQAVSALGLTFGAVDLGELADGSLRVLEVNRAPGLEGNSIGTYVKAVTRWVERGEKREARGNGPRVQEDDNPF